MDDFDDQFGVDEQKVDFFEGEGGAPDSAAGFSAQAARDNFLGGSVKDSGSTPIDGEQTSVQLRERMRTDPRFLPSLSDISTAFPLSEVYDAQKGWLAFCQDKTNPVFEMLNKEYVDAFSDYLEGRLDELGATEENPVTILEVGAGNGRLTHFLQERLGAKAAGRFRAIATDDKSWKSETETITEHFPVENVGHEDAIKKYKPDIVVSSWMSYQKDWTPAFRQEENVREYVLIGDPTITANHEAWGVDDNYSFIPDYAAGGFRRTNLSEVVDKQICRSDMPDKPGMHSETVSFRRE